MAVKAPANTIPTISPVVNTWCWTLAAKVEDASNAFIKKDEETLLDAIVVLEIEIELLLGAELTFVGLGVIGHSEG